MHGKGTLNKPLLGGGNHHIELKHELKHEHSHHEKYHDHKGHDHH
jgi:hypothetical protein